MRPPPTFGFLRVRHPREEIHRATQVGLERKREGYSPEALVLAVDEILQDLPLSRAIVVYIQSVSDQEDKAAIERPFSWFSVLMGIGFMMLCLWLVMELFRLVRPDTGIFTVILIVLGQSLLLKIAKRSVRHAVTSAIDGLNDASYPTNMHPLRNAPAPVGGLRLQRLRGLVQETADRLAKGESAKSIEAELSEVDLTPKASRWVVRLARFNAAVRDYIPPYESRWLGITLGIVFVATCLFFVERPQNELAEGYQLYAIAVAAWIGGDLAARPRRRPQLPAS